MRPVIVAGVGMTRFGRFPDVPVERFGREAAWDALKDAGLQPRDLQVAYVGNLTERRETGHVTCVAQQILRGIGVTGVPITRVENACASGSTAFREAWLAVASGLADIALALGVEKLNGRGPAPLGRVGETLEGLAGLAPPGVWAMRAQRHMHRFGSTRRQMAMVAVKNRRHARLNPRAALEPKEITVDDVLNAPSVCTPLTLLDSCPTTDGGAAAVLCSEAVAQRLGVAGIRVAAAALVSGTYEAQRDIAVNELETRAARAAFEQAGMGPGDLDFAEVHDCFTIAEIVRIENLGLCAEGEGGPWVESGQTALGGRFPVNPSGGLLCKGHPVGATGIAQVAEIVWQLRGQAGARQVQGARAALAHCSGGFVGDDTGASAVIILKR